MNLGDFKEHIEKQPNTKVFNFSLSEPFSWRGSYNEVAFDIDLNEKSTKSDLLIQIEKALTETFYGYKGGEYRFDKYTPVNFERDGGSYTGGDYCRYLIEKITEEEFVTAETKLIKLLLK